MTEAEIKTATAIYDQAFNDVMDGTALTIRKAVASRVAEALATARSETWKAAMGIANTCLQEHDHTVNEDGERHNPAACIYFALEAAANS